MRKAAILFGALAVLSLLALAQDQSYYDNSFARLTYVKGDVVVERVQDLGSEQGVVNLALVEGDKLETKDGWAEVHFGRKNYLRFDRATIVEFSNLPQRGDDRTRLHLTAGRIYLRISAMDEEKSFEVHTPDASFYVLEEGLYRFEARANGETEMAVIEGSIEAAGEEGSQLIGSREMLLASNGHLGTQSSLAYSRDDFDDWNNDRDSVNVQYASKQYLPAELDAYEDELAENGYWAYERPYGYVWVPHVYHSDWRPYYYGRWLWYPICGWTWVSSEPWGWCTYHYGRWGWGLGMGWYWIPTTVWGPGWVDWYWGYDYCGWSPLSWYNYPCVVINNYFYDRYHSPYYPCDSRAFTVVHKDQLQNPHIERAALGRVEASRLGNISLRKQQPDLKPTISRSSLRGLSPSNSLTRPQIRPSTLGKSLGASKVNSPSRVTENSGFGKGRTVSRDGQAGTQPRVSSDNLIRNRDVSNYPSSGSSGRSVRVTSGSVSSGPRKIRTESSAPGRSSSLSSRSATKSYSSSPRISSPSTRSPVERRGSAGVYSPDARISRYGTSYGLNSARSSERQTPSFGGSSGYVSPRQDYSPRGSSFSSPSRSGFSAPRMSTPSRSSGFSSPSFSRSSSRSFSAPSSSSAARSSPRASSPSRGSSGHVSKRNG